MIHEAGKILFGFFEGTPYGPATDKIEEFLSYRNSLDRALVVGHFDTLNIALSSEEVPDIFTGERFNAGICEDGDYVFPIDLVRYYKTQNMGIPYEYEEYLKTILE